MTSYASLIIPTFNEAGNILILLEQIEHVMSGHAMEIIVVDDHSPDGTAELVQAYAQQHPQVRCVRRMTQRGLSAAVQEGFDQSHAPILAVMDADLSHDVNLLPRLLNAIHQGADLAVGSRRLPGGGATHWPWHRRVTSNFATFFAKYWLRVSLSDPMSGYFALQRSLYGACRTRLQSRGYKILLEIFVRARPQHVVEFPFIFVDRRVGHSKLTLGVMLDYVRMLWSLRQTKWRW